MGQLIREEIPKRGGACHICGAPFSLGTSIISHLFLSEQKTLVRVDSCIGCPVSEKETISCWKTVMHKEKRGAKQKEESAKKLFCLLLKEESQSIKLYVLSLYLERRRILVRRGEVIKEGHNFLIFESMESGEVYSILQRNAHEIPYSEIEEELCTIL